MVQQSQPSFSHPKKATASTAVSPTQPLDTFLDNQHQTYFEELYRSEAVCICILRCVSTQTRSALSSSVLNND